MPAKFYTFKVYCYKNLDGVMGEILLDAIYF